MIRTDYNLPIFQDTDIADLNYYTNELASALKVQIDRFGSPLTFKGIVSTLADLDNLAAENGDIYNVTAINKNYVYNGTEWLEYSDTINNSCQELISDEYNSILTYNVGDFCIYNNQLYKCNTQITTPENWTAAHWTQTKVSNELEEVVERVFEASSKDIPSNSDLNNYTTPGTYRCPTGTVSQTLSNNPAGNVGFKLIVECTSSSERYRQTIYANRISGDLTYVRHYNGSWGNWYKFNMTQA